MDKGFVQIHRKARSSQPNVVFIMGDDVGWADVPWNNKELRLEF
jgi:arylsulfatase A-like enzyme